MTQKSEEKTPEVITIVGLPIIEERNFCWCICGSRHLIRKTATGNFRVNCPELGYSFLTKTVRGLVVKLLTAYTQIVNNMTEEQKQRATEIMIARRVIEKMEGKRENFANLARARSLAKDLYRKSYLKDNGKGVVVNFNDGHIELDFSGEGSEEKSTTE